MKIKITVGFRLRYYFITSEETIANGDKFSLALPVNARDAAGATAFDLFAHVTKEERFVLKQLTEENDSVMIDDNNFFRETMPQLFKKTRRRAVRRLIQKGEHS